MSRSLSQKIARNLLKVAHNGGPLAFQASNIMGRSSIGIQNGHGILYSKHLSSVLLPPHRWGQGAPAGRRRAPRAAGWAIALGFCLDVLG